MAMPLMKQEIYTLEDIFTLPEGERAELLEGELYMNGAAEYGASETGTFL